MPTTLLDPRVSRRDSALPGDWRRRAPRWVTGLTAANAVLVAALLVLLCAVSEDWWVSAALGYLPRAPWLAPSLLLIVASLLFRRSLVLVNILAALILAGPVMGVTAPLASAPPLLDDQAAITILSCNVQNGAGDMDTLLAEFDAVDAQIVALQETKWGVDPLAGHFDGWHIVHEGEFWIGSRYPVQLIDVCTPEAFGRTTAILCEVETPQGPVLIGNVHLNTARHGLLNLRWHSLLSGAGVDDFEWHQWQRRLEAEATLQFFAQYAGRPMIILGDFNTQSNSSLFTDVWSGYTSAFDSAGWGYGYTAPCNTGRFWPDNTPWLRIDHILVDDAWQVHACEIGQTNGSDHRLIWSRLSPSSRAAPKPGFSLAAADRFLRK